MFLFFFKGNSQEDFFQRATLQSSTMGKGTFPVGVSLAKSRNSLWCLNWISIKIWELNQTSLAKLCSLTVHRGEVMHKSILAVTTPYPTFFLSAYPKQFVIFSSAQLQNSNHRPQEVEKLADYIFWVVLFFAVVAKCICFNIIHIQSNSYYIKILRTSNCPPPLGTHDAHRVAGVEW